MANKARYRILHAFGVDGKDYFTGGDEHRVGSLPDKKLQELIKNGNVLELATETQEVELPTVAEARLAAAGLGPEAIRRRLGPKNVTTATREAAVSETKSKK